MFFKHADCFLLSVHLSAVFCPDGWFHIRGRCYKVSSNSLSWNASKLACEALSSHLLIVNSQAEQRALSALKRNSGSWIGLRRDDRNKNHWIWWNGLLVSYYNWAGGEPNNINEECVVMDTSQYGKWYDDRCSERRPYICEMNVSDECANNPCKNGATCTNLIRGYKCICSQGFRGYHCDQVSDMCSASNNGGCSHKCVNTPGGYKCECPDPELILSSDNKTCYAPGVDVYCNSQNMTIVIPKSLLRGIDREHLRLLDTRCKATETGLHFSLTTPLTGCKTTSRHTPSAIVYSNAVLEIPVGAEDVITRVREIEILFSCFYSRYGVASSVGWKHNQRKLLFSDAGKGNFSISLKMFPDNTFLSPYIKNDFPVAVVLRKRLFFEVSVTSDDKQLSIRADRCYATPTQDRMNLLKYEFIKNSCPSDKTVKYHAVPSHSAQRFSLEAFKFIADHPFVFVHCRVIICNATNPNSQCTKTCPKSGRGRRHVGGQMTDDVYTVSQGPLHLASGKREEINRSGLDKTGSSTFPMIALSVFCVACLVGTALIVYKKSRKNPAGYSVLANGYEQ